MNEMNEMRLRMNFINVNVLVWLNSAARWLSKYLPKLRSKFPQKVGTYFETSPRNSANK